MRRLLCSCMVFLALLPAASRAGDVTFSLGVSDRFAIRGHDGAELFRVDESGAISPPTVYARTLVVGPVGTPKENGAALRSAVSGINDASESAPWLVKVEPGLYDTGSAGVFVKDWVHLEGSGEGITVIQSTGDEEFFSPYTLQAGSNTQIRFLTLRSFSGVADTGHAFLADSRQNVSLQHVTLFAHSSNGASRAAEIILSNNVTLRHVNAQAEGGTSFRNEGVLIGESTNVTLADVRAIGIGSLNLNAGIRVFESPNTVLRRVFAAGAGGIRSAGLESVRSTIQVRDCELRSLLASSLYGIFLNDGSGVLTYDARVEGSILAGATAPINASARSRRWIAHSRLEGGAITGANITCAFVHDENFAAHTSTCP